MKLVMSFKVTLRGIPVGSSLSSAVSRRTFLSHGVSCLLTAPAWAVLSPLDDDGPFPLSLPEDEWRQLLGAERYRIMREAAMETPHSSPLLHEERPGVYVCAGCGQALFSSTAKIASDSGWPSFSAPIRERAITLVPERYWTALLRPQIYCARCGGHLGLVVNDGPPPRGLRFSLSGLALHFVAARQKNDKPSTGET